MSGLGQDPSYFGLGLGGVKIGRKERMDFQNRYYRTQKEYSFQVAFFERNMNKIAVTRSRESVGL